MLTHVSPHHDFGLVILATLVSAAGSLTTFTIYGHLIARGGRHRIAWLLLTGFCAGAGIWATHFVAMLAHQSGLSGSYDPFLTVTSFAIAAGVTTLGIAVSLRPRREMIGAGGAIIGVGIAAMHFIGMYAVRAPAIFQWNAALILLAILLGVAFAAGAMLAYRELSGVRALLSGAALFTLSICSLHFTAMAALTVVASPGIAAPAFDVDGVLLAVVVAGLTALILLAGYVVALMDERSMREGFELTGELVEAAMEGLVIADNGIIVNINAKISKLCGRKGNELIGKKVFGDLLPESYRPASSGAHHLLEVPLLRADGAAIPVEVVRRPLRALSRSNEVYAIRDLREREEAARQLSEANQELHRREQDLRMRNLILDSALQNMSQGLCVYDKNRRVVICNERFAQIYGLRPDAIRAGMTLKDVIQLRIDNGIYAGASPSAYLEDQLSPVVKAENSIHELNNGQIIALARRPMPGGGWVATHEDVTEQRRMEAQVTHLANHDSLTGLLRRATLRDRLQEGLKVPGKRDRRLAVLAIGMDRFSEINDTLGHAAGDALLRAIAGRLQEGTRRSTLLGRCGDDTFVVVEAVGHPGRDGTGLAKRLQEEIRKPFVIEGTSLEITATIGIAVSPADGSDADTLLKNATLALNRGKVEARGTHHFFEPAMDKELKARRALERDLAEALETRQFEIEYQPLVNLAHNEISGFEALLRWYHPDRGPVPPESFRPLAEETGLVTAIGEWTLREACAEAVGWPKHLTVAVGVSAAHFRSPDFVRSIVTTLAATGLTAGRLEIEISEKALHDNTEQATRTLHQLSELGVLIALNEFGAGFSSLTFLRRFPVHKIKIDRSFLTDASARQDSQVIIRTLARVGAGLGMITTLDGVETKEQIDLARTEGFTEMQGQYFSPPKTADQVRILVRPAAPGLVRAS